MCKQFNPCQTRTPNGISRSILRAENRRAQTNILQIPSTIGGRKNSFLGTTSESISSKSTTLLLILSLTILPANNASADFFDKLKTFGGKVKDVKESIVGTREVFREVEDLRQTVVYADSYTPQRGEISMMQSALNQLGYSSSNPDGLMGEKTRNGIRLFQSMTGRTADGVMSYDVVQGIISAGRQSNSVSAQLQKFEWQQYQQLLNQLGYNTGTPDGVPGPRTRAAVAQFLKDNQLPIVDKVDRYGFDVAQRVAVGGLDLPNRIATNNPGFSANSGSIAPNQQQIQNSGSGELSATNQNSALTDALSEVKVTSNASLVQNEGEWMTLGSDRRNGGSDEAAQRALALMLISDNPEVLDNLNRVDTWFKLEGNVVESEYLREPALQNFRETLRQQSAERPVKLRVLSSVFVRRGDFDQTAGIFKVSVGNSSYGNYFGLPHLGFSSVKLGLTEQYPSVSPGDHFRGAVIGIPMTLEQAIAFERSEMINSRGNPEDVVMMTLVSEALVNTINMDPLERGQDASQNNFRNISASSTLTGLSLFKRPVGTNAEIVGELVYQWPATSFSPSPQSDLLAPTEDVEVSASLQAIAQRFGMSIVNGHLDTSTGDSGSFAAALALGKKPELLDKKPESLLIASALLSREERRELFGGNNHYFELDEITSNAIHQRIKGELRQLFLSRAVSHDLPLLLVHPARLGDYVLADREFKLITKDSSVYSGRFAINRGSGSGPLLVADTGDRWVPEIVKLGDADAADLRQKVFGNQKNRSYAEIRHGRFGRVSELYVRAIGSSTNRGQSPSMSVTLNFSVQREVLLAQRFDEVLMDLSIDVARQESFSKLVSAVSKPISKAGALVEAVSSFPEVAEFRQQLILSSSTVTSANEFDRGERIQEVSEYLTEQAASHSGPFWLTGTVKLGEYQFDSESFSVDSLTLKAAPGNTSSNQIRFRAQINHKHFGSLNVSMTKDEARQFVNSNAGRTATVRARVTPMSAVASLGSARPGSASLTITYQVNELALVETPREENRQQWRLLSHDVYEEAMISTSGSEAEIEPLTVNWESDPFLKPDVLLLMAAQASQLDDERAWMWLQENRHVYDSHGLTEFSTGFFSADTPNWDRSIGQIKAAQFRQWVNSLEFPDLQQVKVHLSTGYQMERSSLGHCHLGRTATQWSQNIEPSFNRTLSAEQVRVKSQAVSQLHAGEFLVEAPISVGFISTSAMACRDGRVRGEQTIQAPKITLTFNQLPLTAMRSAAEKSAVVSARVDGIEFTSGDSPIPDITIALTFEKADYHSAMDFDTSPIVRTITKDELVSEESQGKDPRLAAADVVGVKLGMTLEEASSILESHFGQSKHIAIRRGFTTKPSKFEQGELWVADQGGEYIVLFHEGDASSATVLGVVRGLYLEGADFDRNTALSVLRDKYGPEDIVSAEDSLNMVWGKHVDSWPLEIGKRQSSSKYGRGACQIELRQGRVPTNLRDDEGALLELREVLQVSGRSQGFHVRWPQVAQSSAQEYSSCDYYLEAFHDDRANTRVFVGMFDLSAYEAGFSEILSANVVKQDDTGTKKGNKSAVKF